MIDFWQIVSILALVMNWVLSTTVRCRLAAVLVCEKWDVKIYMKDNSWSQDNALLLRVRFSLMINQKIWFLCTRFEYSRMLRTKVKNVCLVWQNSQCWLIKVIPFGEGNIKDSNILFGYQYYSFVLNTTTRVVTIPKLQLWQFLRDMMSYPNNQSALSVMDGRKDRQNLIIVSEGNFWWKWLEIIPYCLSLTLTFESNWIHVTPMYQWRLLCYFCCFHANAVSLSFPKQQWTKKYSSLQIKLHGFLANNDRAHLYLFTCSLTMILVKRHESPFQLIWIIGIANIFLTFL